MYETSLRASLMESTCSLNQSQLESQSAATWEEQLRNWMTECLKEGEERTHHCEFLDKWLHQALQSSECAALQCGDGMKHSVLQRVARRRRRWAMVESEMETTHLDGELQVDFDDVVCSITSSIDAPLSEKRALFSTVHHTKEPADKQQPPQEQKSVRVNPLRPGQQLGGRHKANFTGPTQKDSVIRKYLTNGERRASSAPNKGRLHDSALDHNYVTQTF